MDRLLGSSSGEPTMAMFDCWAGLQSGGTLR